MGIVLARASIHHPCPYCDLSVEFPRSLILLWCDNRRDVFLVSSPDEEEANRILGRMKSRFSARPLVRDGADALVELRGFEWSRPPSVTSLARKMGVWVLHPVVYFAGRETYRLVAASKPGLQRFLVRLRSIGELELLSVAGESRLGSVREWPVGPLRAFEGLTARQARSLVAAYEGGLLDVPARAEWGEVARREGLSRSTFGEHLRKGQRRLVESHLSSLKIRATIPLPPRRRRRAGVPAPEEAAASVFGW